MKIDAELCSVIKSTIHTSLKPIFCPLKMCASIWSDANALHTNNLITFLGLINF